MLRLFALSQSTQTAQTAQNTKGDTVYVVYGTYVESLLCGSAAFFCCLNPPTTRNPPKIHNPPKTLKNVKKRSKTF